MVTTNVILVNGQQRKRIEGKKKVLLSVLLLCPIILTYRT